MDLTTTITEADVKQTLPDLVEEKPSQREELRLRSDDGEVDVIRTTVKATWLMQRC